MRPATALGPEDAQAKLDHAGPGDVLVFRKGRYTRPLRLAARSGRPDAPILLVAEPGAVLDGRRRLADFNPDAQAVAKIDYDKGRKPPGIQAIATDAFLTIDACDHVQVEGLAIEGAWPTAVMVDNCTNVVLRRLDIREGTFAFFLHGERTRRVVIEECHWVQDVSEGDLWRRITWDRVHGDDWRPDDMRGLDGDFVRSYRIAGELVVRRNRIEHAVNGVHCFSRRQDPPEHLNNDVLIYDNDFCYVRDNPIEPEDRYTNWWVFNNQIYNCHKWFSIEVERSDLLYLFGNIGWFDEVQGPPGDKNNGGAVFKMPKTREYRGRHYIFHNSWYLRSAYIKDGEISGFLHTNNAALYCNSGATPAPFCKPGVRLLSSPDDEPKRKAFTKEWARLGIAFVNDRIGHPDFPNALKAAGYAIEDGPGGDPGFVDPGRGDFRLRSGSACAGRARPFTIDLPGGGAHEVRASDIGAVQPDGLFRLPPGVVPDLAPEPLTV